MLQKNNVNEDAIFSGICTCIDAANSKGSLGTADWDSLLRGGQGRLRMAQGGRGLQRVVEGATGWYSVGESDTTALPSVIAAASPGHEAELEKHVQVDHRAEVETTDGTTMVAPANPAQAPAMIGAQKYLEIRSQVLTESADAVVADNGPYKSTLPADTDHAIATEMQQTVTSSRFYSTNVDGAYCHPYSHYAPDEQPPPALPRVCVLHHIVKGPSPPPPPQTDQVP